MFDYDVYKIYDLPEDLSTTWEMLEKGKNLGVFQLESPLLTTWTKKLKPKSLDDNAILVAAVRPGVLNTSDSEGRNMAQVIVDRRNGVDEVKYLHPLLERALKPTYGVLLYQEQLMYIAEDIAGWSKLQGLDLQKAVAKKKADKVAELKKVFIEDATKLGRVTREEATTIYESMEASARYLFNSAHSYGYGFLSLTTAYWKSVSPMDTFVARLQRSDSAVKPQEEVAKLVQECISENIDVKLPSALDLRENFDIVDDSYIVFGATNIKGVGNSAYKQVKNILSDVNENWNWLKILTHFGHKIQGEAKIPHKVFQALIECGAFSHLKVPRRRMLFELDNYVQLSTGAQKWMRDNHLATDDLLTLLKMGAKTKKEGGAAHTEKQIPVINGIIKQLEKPPYQLEDSIDWILIREKELLGISLTYTKLDKFESEMCNATLKQFSEGNGLPNPAIFLVEVVNVRPCQTKKGKNPGQDMAQLTLKDTTTILSECVIFPKEWEQYSEHFTSGAVLLIEGESDRFGKSLIIKRASKLQRIIT